MRCPLCGAPAPADAVRCTICGQSLARPAAAERPEPGDVFVGRARELAVLTEVLDDARAGRGRLALLAGEPGIGKTRLTGEIAALARQKGARVLAGRAWETDGAPPYWPWSQVLRALAGEPDADALRAAMAPLAADLAHVLPEIGVPRPAAGPEEGRFRAFASVASVIERAARGRPLVLVLDDLHWFDAPSLRLFELAARELSRAPALIVGTYRDVGLRSGDVLTHVVGALVREPFCRSLALAGLPADDVARIAEHATGAAPASALVRTLMDETGGNPFFVTETVRLLVAERGGIGAAGGAVPHGLRAAIGRRLEGLSQPCRKVLLLAAMLGREFGAPVLDALGAAHNLGPTGDWLSEALDEAVEARLVTVVPHAVGRYAFTHALIREALYEELNPARRARLHRDIAQVVEALADLAPDRPPAPGAGRFLAEVAYHYAQAIPAGGDVARAAAYATRAGDQALDVLAYEEAARHYRRALDARALAPGDDAERGALLLRLGRAESRAGEVARAEAAFERAIDLARRRSGEEAARLFARAVLGLGGEWWMDSADLRPRYLDLLDEALARLDAGDGALRAEVLSRLAVRLYFVPGAAARRRALGDEAVRMARRVGDPVTLARALTARRWAIWDPAHLDERAALTIELVRLVERIGARDLAFQAHVFRLGDLLELGDLAGVDAEIETMARLSAELRQPTYEWWLPMFRAMRALLEGRFAEAERLAEAGAMLGQRVQGSLAVAIFGAHLVWLRRAQGREAELEAVVRGMVDLHPTEISWRVTLAFILTELDRRDAAREEMERVAARDFTDLPDDLRGLATLALAAQVAAYLGDGKRAALLAPLLAPHASTVIAMASGAGPCLGAASRYLALALATQGKWEEAELQFRDAVARNGRLRSRPLVALTSCDWGFALRRRNAPGNRERADELIAAAHATARDLGMAGLIARIERVAAPAPPPPARRPAPGPAAPSGNVFHKDGEFWTIVFGNGTCRLKDAKGLRYLSALLHAPEREFHVLDLAALTDARPDARLAPEQLADEDLHVAGPGDRPIPLDARARAAYKQRVVDLRAELTDAERFNDAARAEHLREEIEVLSGELAAAYGRIGKRAGGDEQVRKNVTNCIRNSLTRIGRSNPALGRHLTAAVKTGVFCAYRPEHPVDWSE